MDNKKIGDYISLLRKKKNLTQKEIADLLGITDKAISKWERGAGYPDISLLKPLADILGTTVNELLEGEEYQSLQDNSQAQLDKALEYADKLVISKENKLGKTIATLLGSCLLIAICTSFIVNVAVNHKLSWSLLVLEGCILAGCLLIPLLVSKKHRIIYSLGFLTVLILPFLGIMEFIISKSVTASGWFRGIGLPVSLTWLAILWIIFIIYKKSKLNLWYFSCIALLLCIPGELITNYVIDVFTHFSRDPVSRSINYVTNIASVLAAAGLCLIIGLYRNKSKNQVV